MGPARTVPDVPWQPSGHPEWTRSVLGTERNLAWAYYLTAVHKQLHGSFTTDYLGGVLGKAPKDDPRNDPSLIVLLHIVFAPSGAIAALEVAKPSGVDAFDRESMDALARSAPFPPPPPILRSPDGNAYASWALFRDPVYGCSTMGTRPFLFEVAAGASAIHRVAR